MVGGTARAAFEFGVVSVLFVFQVGLEDRVSYFPDTTECALSVCRQPFASFVTSASLSGLSRS